MNSPDRQLGHKYKLKLRRLRDSLASPQNDISCHSESSEGSNRIKNKSGGFSMAEALIILLFVSIALAVTVPAITSRNTTSSVANTAIDCILNNATGIVFDANGHITTYPESGSCYAAYYGCQVDKEGYCDTLTYYADGNGSTDQQTAALNILRASCDKGGNTACDYFLTRCIENETNCSSPDAKYTLGYYLNLSDDTVNEGKTYIQTKGTDYYNYNMTTFVNAVDTVCATPGLYVACIIKGTTEIPPPSDPACGAEDIGSIRVSKCNNAYNLVANNVNPNGAGCWEGKDLSCNGTGCSRPVCNWAGAEQACSALNGGVDYGEKGWRLPTRDEMQQWRVTYGSNTAIKAEVQSLMDFCAYNSGYSPYCNHYSGCSGATLNTCYPSRVWSAESSGSNYYIYYLYYGSWYGPSSNYNTGYAFSTRCVRSL